MKVEDKLSNARILLNDVGNAISDCVNISPEVFEDPLLVEQIKDFRWVYDRSTERLKELCNISCSPMKNSILNGILTDVIESYKILSTSLVVKIESNKHQEVSRLQIIYNRAEGLQNLFAGSIDLPVYKETNLYEISSQSYKTVSQDQEELEYILDKELDIQTDHLEKSDSSQTQQDELKLEDVLKQCTDTSAKSYEICNEYTTKLEIILKDLYQTIQSEQRHLSRSSTGNPVNSSIKDIKTLI